MSLNANPTAIQVVLILPKPLPSTSSGQLNDGQYPILPSKAVTKWETTQRSAPAILITGVRRIQTRLSGHFNNR
jgi:hypothetical protein